MDTGAARTGTGHIGKLGTTSIPVPDISVCSVRHQYRYGTLRWVRYEIHTGTENTGTSPDTPSTYFVYDATQAEAILTQIY